ncbi:MAG TPA: nucleotidyl transferase AbiEii/AbiGii toxin family protein [Gemmataceae bacterium]|nr:nucleotidyl transferase AbiEii/AbiGii toxin family protein [Gemmataceae bacterium]
MIPQRNLALLSNRLAKAGGRRIPEGVLERDYCLAWFLIGLSRTPLRERLAFKGGTALKRCYFGDYRFSEDLDFTLRVDVPFDVIRQELEPVFAEVGRAGGVTIRFAHEDRQVHQNSHTFYLSYEGPLPATARPKEVKVDITIREEVVFPLEARRVLRAYEEYQDLPEDAVVLTYSLSEIAAEKVVALLDAARNEPRDLFDIWFLASGGHVDLGDVIHAIEKKWEFRGKKPADAREALESKEARYKKLWDMRLAAQMAELPEFAEVFRLVRRALRDAGIIGK